MVQKVAGLNHSLAILQLENLICQPAISGYLFQTGKDKLVKGEGWAQSCICSEPLSLLLLWPLGYGKPLLLRYGIKGITAHMQIGRCVLEFCLVDKISICSSIFDDAEIV